MRMYLYSFLVLCRPITRHLARPFLRLALEVLGLAAVCFKADNKSDEYDSIERMLDSTDNKWCDEPGRSGIYGNVTCDLVRGHDGMHRWWASQTDSYSWKDES